MIDFFKEQLFKKTIPFWTKHMCDSVYGGVFTSLTREGVVYSTDKSVWMQGRSLYIFSELINRFGKNEEYLKIALSCKKFMDEHCFDTDGRMYFLVTREGEPLRKRRYYFSECFYIMGSAQLFKATQDTKHIEDAKRVYGLCRSIYADPKNDPYKITSKGYDSTRAYHSLAPSMIMLNVAQIMAECSESDRDIYLSDAKRFAEDIIKFHYKPEIKAVLENTGLNGEIYDFCPSDRLVNPGHAIEASWFLMEYAEKTNAPSLLPKALNILDWSTNLGWDSQFDGLFYFVDYKGLPVEPLEAEQKLWWPHDELMIASLLAYKQTKDEKYLKLFLKVKEYYFSHFTDDEFGDCYGYLQRDGTPFKALKGSTFKGPFHHPRMLLKCIEILEELGL